MSATICVVLDINSDALRELGRRQNWVKVSDAYVNCSMALSRPIQKAPLRKIEITEFDLVEIEGPWNAVLQLTKGAVKLGLGVKWGVFLDDKDERAACLAEMICLARACGARRLIGFANEGYGAIAYAKSLEGGDFFSVLAEIKADILEISIREDGSPCIDEVSKCVEDNADRLETGFFLLTIL